MKTDSITTAQKYNEAHNEHYANKDLSKALDLYKSIIQDHPNSKESGYSRSQIGNIVHSVVPRQVYLDAVIEVALTQLKQKEAH